MSLFGCYDISMAVFAFSECVMCVNLWSDKNLPESIWKQRIFSPIYFLWTLNSMHYIISSEPNVGIVNVPDKRLDVLGEIHNSVKVIPAAVRYYGNMKYTYLWAWSSASLNFLIYLLDASELTLFLLLFFCGTCIYQFFYSSLPFAWYESKYFKSPILNLNFGYFSPKILDWICRYSWYCQRCLRRCWIGEQIFDEHSYDRRDRTCCTLFCWWWYHSCWWQCRSLKGCWSYLFGINIGWLVTDREKTRKGEKKLRGCQCFVISRFDIENICWWIFLFHLQ